MNWARHEGSGQAGAWLLVERAVRPRERAATHPSDDLDEKIRGAASESDVDDSETHVDHSSATGARAAERSLTPRLSSAVVMPGCGSAVAGIGGHGGNELLKHSIDQIGVNAPVSSPPSLCISDRRTKW